MIGAVLGEYRVVGKAGEGAFGRVWECEDAAGRKFAIKEVSKSILTPDLLDKLQTEVKIAQKYSHPNIVRCFATLQSANNFYLVFEFCSGGDLKGFLRQRKRLPLGEALAIMRQLRDAYEFLYSHSILHRDIKLENVLLADRDARLIKLSDFGCSKMDQLSTTYCGTPKYMAFEVISHAGEHDYKADLWALGLVFWELLFGFNCFPFSVGSLESLRKDICERSGQNLCFPKEPLLPPEFYEFLVAVLQKEPDRRIAAVDFFRHRVFDHVPAAAEAPPERQAAGPPDPQVERLGPRAPKQRAAGPADEVAQLVLEHRIERFFADKLFEARLSLRVGKEAGAFGAADGPLTDQLLALSVIVLSRAAVRAEQLLLSLSAGENSFGLEGFGAMGGTLRAELAERARQAAEQMAAEESRALRQLIANADDDSLIRSVKDCMARKWRAETDAAVRAVLGAAEARGGRALAGEAAARLARLLGRAAALLSGGLGDDFSSLL